MLLHQKDDDCLHAKVGKLEFQSNKYCGGTKDSLVRFLYPLTRSEASFVPHNVGLDTKSH